MGTVYLQVEFFGCRFFNNWDEGKVGQDGVFGFSKNLYSFAFADYVFDFNFAYEGSNLVDINNGKNI